VNPIGAIMITLNFVLTALIGVLIPGTSMQVV
jgi:hypothetical protein